MSANPQGQDVQRRLSEPERAVGPVLSVIERSRLGELEAVIERGVKTFIEVGTALAEVRDARLYRETHGTFEDYMRHRWSWSRAQGYRMIDAARVAEVVSPMGDIAIANERQARELAPLLDDEAELLDAVRELRSEYGGRVTAKKIRQIVARRLERAGREEALADERARLVAAARTRGEQGPSSGVVVADLREWTPADQVDAIITDPPYVTDDAVELHAALAAFALRCLRPGGALVVMTWQPLVADVLDVLRVGDLRYSWQYAWTFATREKTAQHRHRVFDGYKPILVLHRGEPDADRPYINDVIVSPGADKRFHEWGQNVDGFRRLVRGHALPGQLVCDPFLGAGTTGVAALSQGCRFVGCDVDAHAVEIARGRLQTATLMETECPGDA